MLEYTIANSRKNQTININNDLSFNSYVGEVVANEDPLFMGRCKVKIVGVFDDLTMEDGTVQTLTPEQLPWCYPGGSSVFGSSALRGGGSFSVPRIGSIVKIVFFQGEMYAPEYYSIAQPSDEIREWVKDSYLKSQILLFDVDEKVQITYKIKDDTQWNNTGQRGGLSIWNKGSYVDIRNNGNIQIVHKERKSHIQLVDEKIESITGRSTGTRNSGTIEFKTSRFVIDCDEFIVNTTKNVNLNAKTSISMRANTTFNATSNAPMSLNSMLVRVGRTGGLIENLALERHLTPPMGSPIF